MIGRKGENRGTMMSRKMIKKRKESVGTRRM
jgi:hypothetical protein